MDTRPWTHKCIGTILANNAILTTAKCVENLEEDLKIRTGNENLDDDDNELRTDFRIFSADKFDTRQNNTPDDFHPKIEIVFLLLYSFHTRYWRFQKLDCQGLRGPFRS